MFEQVKKEASQVITVNDKEYEVNSISESAKYALRHLADIENKLVQKSFELDQLKASKAFFSNRLVEEVEKTDKTE